MNEPARRLVICCDGTWCGREKDTETNIYLLARLFRIPIDDPTDTDVHVSADGRAMYVHGVGLGGTFLE